MDMIDNSKNKENQPIEDIDDAIEKAEARKQQFQIQFPDSSTGVVAQLRQPSLLGLINKDNARCPRSTLT
jgi:hypothetical protein